MRVAPRWRGSREGRIDDIICFVPGETRRDRGRGHRVDRGAGDPDGLPGLDHLPEPGARGRRPGHRGLPGAPAPRSALPGCASGSTPADAATAPSTPSSSGPECEVDLPHKGTITNFAIVTPVQYPGQTETEPFVRAFVLLDGTDVIIPYSAVIELPADQVRVGQRVDAVWASPAEETEEGGGMGGAGVHCSAGSPTASRISTIPTS